jgi:phosphohistidine phosphatase
MQIYLLRHGIAEDRPASGRDEDRALTQEGKKKLRMVLKMAADAGVQPTLILTSPYRRAVDTAEIAADELGYKEDMLKVKALEPDGSPEDVWDEIRVHKSAGALLLAGHEPLFSALAAYLLGALNLEIDFKKGALVRIDVDKMGAAPQGVLRWMLTPKLARAE